ncbi:hypothetical protein TUBRATIS_27920 [Tubulinosema ratisbonensis]|uniref:Uncharacterized protein n=1 Tax=Tubulinosema ratisbonensis TaxID=291195 RepID=A0A437AHW7_9MICR|nr:hypothetical protein TUBRATIS_27920 [Tubulinosema ratisbonensis]
MEESKKLKLSITKHSSSPKEDKDRDNTYINTLYRTLYLDSAIKAPIFSDRIKVNIYEFEKEIHAHKIYFEKKHENKKIKKDFKKIILNSFVYFNQIKHLPLSFVVKKSNKLIYLNDRKVIERENKDFKILRKIDKLRKKNELLEEILVNEDFIPKVKHEVKSEKVVLKKLRGYFFKKRKYKLEENIENKNEVLKKHMEIIRIILKVPLRKKKETNIKKEYVLHSTIVNITNKIVPEIKALQMPIDYLNFRKNESLKSLDLACKNLSQPFLENKIKNSPECTGIEVQTKETGSPNRSKNETENSAQ